MSPQGEIEKAHRPASGHFRWVSDLAIASDKVPTSCLPPWKQTLHWMQNSDRNLP